MRSAPSAPPSAARPLPRAKVRVKSLPVSMPIERAIARLSTAARTIAPQRVRSRPIHSAAISAALGRLTAPGNAEALHQRDHQIAAGHREHAVREVDEAHQAHRHRQADRDRVQDHSVREPVEGHAYETRKECIHKTKPPAGGGFLLFVFTMKRCFSKNDYFLLFISFQGSFTALIVSLSISTFAVTPPTLRPSRMYSFCTMSRVCGSI